MEQEMKHVQMIVELARSIHWQITFGPRRHTVYANLVIMETIANLVHCASIQLNAAAKVRVESINSQTEPLWRNVCVTAVISAIAAQITRV